MSAIAKPGAIFTNAINSTTPVPVESVIDVSKVDIPAAPNAPASTATFNIIFTCLLPGQTATKQITIKFATSAARNTSYTNYITANAASVA